MKNARLLLCGIGLAALTACTGPSSSITVKDQIPLGRARIAVPPNAVVDVYWKLIELNGAPAPLGSGGKEAHLLLQLDKPIVRGFGGCNRFSGEYVLDGDKLLFNRLISTRMACAEGMTLESEYLAALGRVAGWTREKQNLSLSDAAGQVVARFMAREL